MVNPQRIGIMPFVAAMASLTTGTLLLVIVAGMIRQHGLGNGYGALIVSGWAITAAKQCLDGAAAGYVLGLVTLVAIGCATLAMLRMRIGGDDETPLRVPSSGLVPFTTAVSVSGLVSLARFGLALMSGYLVVSVSGLWSIPRWGLIDITRVLAGPRAGVLRGGWYLVGSLVVLVPIWSFAFSRPAITAPLAARGQLAPPSQTSWRRATLLSLVILLLIAVGSLVSAVTSSEALVLGDATLAMIAAAVVLDVLDDLKARRADLIAVWPLQHAQHAEFVRRVLTGVGIECHLQSSHLRTLLGIFGPYVPIDVLVPAMAAEDARARIEPLFQDMTAELEEASSVDDSMGARFSRALRPPGGS